MNILQYFKFIFGGGVSLIINLILTFLLIKIFHIWHMYAYGISLIIEISFLFLYHSIITFGIYGKIVKFIINIIFISTLNWVGVLLMSINLNLNYNISIIIIALIIFIINYYIINKIIFTK